MVCVLAPRFILIGVPRRFLERAFAGYCYLRRFGTDLTVLKVRARLFLDSCCRPMPECNDDIELF